MQARYSLKTVPPARRARPLVSPRASLPPRARRRRQTDADVHDGLRVVLRDARLLTAVLVVVLGPVGRVSVKGEGEGEGGGRGRRG